jgi:hypothetical protein
MNSPLSLFPSATVPYEFGTRDITANLDLANGKVDWKGPYPFPNYIVIPQPPLSVMLDWRPIAHASYIPATLVRVARPLQARTTLGGVTPDGFTSPGTPAVITVYRAARPRLRCVFADLLTSQPNVPKPGLRLRYRVRQGKRVVAHGAVPANELRRVYLPVVWGSAPAVQFSIETFGTVNAINGKVGIQVGNYDSLTTACPAG